MRQSLFIIVDFLMLRMYQYPIRRPFQHYSQAGLKQSEALRNELEGMVFPPVKNMFLHKICMAFCRAVLRPMKMSMSFSNNSCLHFDGKETLFDRLGLKDLENRIVSGKPLYIPENPTNESDRVAERHFPQLAVVWEGQTKDVQYIRTLEVEIGAGFNLLSLKFCPLPSRVFEETLQLDLLNVIRGHDYYELNVENAENKPVIDDILSKVQSIVGQFKAGQVEIDQILNDIVDTVISHQSPANDQDQDNDDAFNPALKL